MQKKIALALAILFAQAPMVAMATSIRCGIPPIRPIGCKVGPCVCDQNGQNCHYEFICN